jgi:hypothetical protein
VNEVSATAMATFDLGRKSVRQLGSMVVDWFLYACVKMRNRDADRLLSGTDFHHRPCKQVKSLKKLSDFWYPTERDD